MLCKMFLIYKLSTRGFSEDINKMNQQLFTTYACQYMELISVVTDLSFYIPLLNDEQRDGIITTLK